MTATSTGPHHAAEANPDAADTDRDAADSVPDAADTDLDAADSVPDAADTDLDAADTDPDPADTDPDAANTDLDAADGVPQADTAVQPPVPPADTALVQPAPSWVPAPERRVHAVPAVIGRALLTFALLCGWFIAYTLGFSALQQGRQQEHLYNQLREQLALATAPLGGPIDPGTPVALLEAPSIGLRQVVVEGTTSDVMRAGPGHRRNSPLPGQPGSSVVYGHASLFGAPFRAIPNLRPGDTITATTGQGQFTYEVTGVRRPSDPTPAPLAAGGGRLILVTAEGARWRTGWAANRIVYVDATLRSTSQLGPPGRPPYIETSEYPLQADPDALIPLVLWLQALAVAAVALVWTRRRWGAIQTWFVGVPVLLACLWGTVESLGQLLPNLS